MYPYDNIDAMGYEIPPLDYFDPGHIYSAETRLKMQEQYIKNQQLKAQRCFLTYYFDYLYDNEENCVMVMRNTDDVEELRLDEKGQVRRRY